MNFHKHLTYTIPLRRPQNIMKWVLLFPFFTEKKILLKGKITFPGHTPPRKCTPESTLTTLPYHLLLTNISIKYLT